MTRPLNPKQARFVQEYLIDLNATQAAIRAGYSAKTAKQQGQRLLTNADIAAAISSAQIKREERTQIDADWLLIRLAEEAQADVADIYNEDMTLKPVHEWPKIWRTGLVAGVKVMEERDQDGNLEGWVKEVKLSDRIRRLELIGKHIAIGAFQDRVKHEGEIALTPVINFNAPKAK